MAVIVGSARSDENGKAYNGKAGDQTGKEVSTQNWYAHSKGWVLLRAKDPDAREKIARCMQAACDNPHIGYDQYERTSLYNAAKEYGFDVSRVTKNVECDCSALVRVCCSYAGINTDTSFRTANQVSVLMATGAFDKYMDDLHTKKSTNVLRGDILVTCSAGHTVVVLSNGSKAAEEMGERVLRKGCGGDDVKALQTRLNELGYSLEVDGDFGTNTEKAVKLFQSRNGLEADGECGPKTRAALEIRQTGKQISITGDAVNIRCGNGTGYRILATASRGTIYEHVATAGNGWQAVVVNDQVGWVSGDYSKVI